MCPSISEITGFSFGGFSSRFQILRKHINSANLIDLKNQNFYSWECLTILTEKKDLDIIIQNEECMDMVLKFLIYKTNTLNGEPGSA